MLRRAMDDAEAQQEANDQQQQQQQQLQQQETTTSATTTPTTTNTTTASTPYDSNTKDADDEEGENHHPAAAAAASSAFEDGGDLMMSEDDDDDDDHEELESHEEEELEDEEEEEVNQTMLESFVSRIKHYFRVIADVENLWDTPPLQQQQQQQRGVGLRRRKFLVLFWFLVAASSYAGERSTFKLLVDRASPFRLFAVQMFTLIHALLLGLGLLLSYYNRKRSQQQSSRQQQSNSSSGNDQHHQLPLGVPLVDVGLMALLDTASLLMVFIAGYHVPPTLTVILVQFTIPLTAFLTQFMHPDGRWTCCPADDTADELENSSPNGNAEVNERTPLVGDGQGRTGGVAPSSSSSFHTGLSEDDDNSEGCTSSAVLPQAPLEYPPLAGWGGLAAPNLWGSLILFLAVLIALLPAFYSIANPAFFYYADPIPIRTALNTLLYVSSCVPAAASQLYKEHVFLQYKQPVNMDYLNLLLSIFQFIFASIVSPLAYGLQGLGIRSDWWELYPAGGFSDNLADGLQCFFGLLSEDDQESKYPEEADCKFTMGLVILHSFSIIAVGVAVDKIVKAGATKVMYRGISAGIIFAVLVLHYYDMHSDDFNYGAAVDGLNLMSVILLILGSEVYHRASLQESSFETVYPSVEVPVFDDYE